MILAKSNALSRVLSICAKILQIDRSPAEPIGSAAVPLDPHIARDIGLTPSEVERLRHRWPSQSTQHPYL
ncbi:hypothetical protein [Tateyamaria sp. SN3-11]|uniref:hypothetical protein n=1 Tax=Tateyamaria sp. SN3-11 TaxID=3092147 RepID=UPI0039ECA8D1